MTAHPLSSSTDGELVGLIRSTDSSATGAWSLLLDRHTPKMYAVARSFDLDQATAEDLVQTAWLRFLERSDQLRDVSLIGPWLCTIVRNEGRRLVTRRRVVPVGQGWDSYPEDTPPPASAIVAAEQAVAVRSAFARLGDDCRQLLRLMLVDPPLTYDEIAAAVDRPRGSLGPSRRRCLERLRQMLPAGVGEEMSG